MIKHYTKIGYTFIKDILMQNNKYMYMYNILVKWNNLYTKM